MTGFALFLLAFCILALIPLIEASLLFAGQNRPDPESRVLFQAVELRLDTVNDFLELLPVLLQHSIYLGPLALSQANFLVQCLHRRKPSTSIIGRRPGSDQVHEADAADYTKKEYGEEDESCLSFTLYAAKHML